MIKVLVAVQLSSYAFVNLRLLLFLLYSSFQLLLYQYFDSDIYVCRCSKCGKNSEASSNMEDFYELELNVKGLKSLDESLDDYLSVEELKGDNQYFCESCKTRVDATRSIKLHTLPPVLNFQLKRYVFLPKVGYDVHFPSSCSYVFIGLCALTCRKLSVELLCSSILLL